MTTRAVRSGFQSVVPYLSVRGAAALVDFLGAAFAAERTFVAPNGRHWEVRIGDCMVMIGDVGSGAPRTGQLFMYVEAPDLLYQRAIDAGATPVMAPGDHPWGEGESVVRGAGVRDPSGNLWFLAGPPLARPAD